MPKKSTSKKSTTVLQELRTRRLVIEDETGAARAVLEASTKHGAVLTFYDGSGSIRVALGYLPTGPRGDETVAAFSDAEGVRRLALGTMGGNPLLHFFDSHGRGRIDMTLMDGEHPGMTFADENSEARLAMGFVNGLSDISVVGPNGTRRATLSIEKDGTAGVVVFDEDGKVIFSGPNAQAVK
jgi:hypothetical protein